jgi:hypothetical protein
MLSMTGVLVAQMLVLSQPATDLAAAFGFHSIGRPVATAFFALSVATVLLGAGRAYRQQHAMIAGRAVVAGPELVGIWAAVAVVSSWDAMGVGVDVADLVVWQQLIVVVFGFMIALDVVSEYGSSR